MYKAKFVTGYLQREIPIDVAVIASADLAVGQLVTYTAASGSNPAYIAPATGSTVTAALNNATHIIAQSDMTMEYGHVPVENRDYRYSDKVAATATQIGASVAVKKVALYAIHEHSDILSDVIAYQVD